MKVTTSEVREAANLLLDHLEDTGQSDVEIDEDFYWVISEDELYNPLGDPTDLSLGQLSSDIEDIRNMISEERPICYGLVWLAAILRRMGEKTIG